MNYFNKIRNLTISVIILAILNISTITTLIILNVNPKNNTELPTPSHNPHRFICSELELDATQKKEFEKFRTEFSTNIKALTQELELKHVELFEEITSDKPDSIKLDQLANETGKIHAALKNESTKFFLSMRSICNEEQEIKLFTIFEDMTNKRGHFHHRNTMHKRPMQKPMNRPLN